MTQIPKTDYNSTPRAHPHPSVSSSASPPSCVLEQAEALGMLHTQPQLCDIGGSLFRASSRGLCLHVPEDGSGLSFGVREEGSFLEEGRSEKLSSALSNRAHVSPRMGLHVFLSKDGNWELGRKTCWIFQPFWARLVNYLQNALAYRKLPSCPSEGFMERESTWLSGTQFRAFGKCKRVVAFLFFVISVFTFTWMEMLHEAKRTAWSLCWYF